jgi:crotonobetainyl-CoA:carnitine CoA-transferase CaiB-like acyl-CoA transferase
MTRLGVDFEVLSKINPALVYCAISGFGADSPLAQRPAYDQIIQGLSGVMSVTGDGQSAPLRVGFPVCDTIGGMTAAFAICAALVEAKTTGKGRFIDVSMLDSTLATMGWVVSNYLNAGVAPTPMGNQNFTAAPSGTFRTKDGLLNIAANETKQYRALCELIGRPDLIADPRFAERQLRKQNREQLTIEIERGLTSKSAAAWEALMTEKGIPAGQVLKVPDVLAQPHIAQRRFLMEFEKDGRVQHVTRPGFRLSTDEAGPRSPAPALSEHTALWLDKLGYDEQQVRQFHEDGVV